MKTVFVDSSVLFSAVSSVTGGSAKLFTLQTISLITSRVVLAEVERNIRGKLAEYHLERFFLLVEYIKVLDIQPDDDLIEEAKLVIVPKDAVILAQAKRAKTDVLVTLDRKHFFTTKVFHFVSPQKVVTPKILLEEIM